MTPDVTSPSADTKQIAKWLLGVGATWVILTLMVDLGDTADLAVAIALVTMGSVLLAYGPKALENLGAVPPTTQGA